jgi:hypothetical protein
MESHNMTKAYAIQVTNQFQNTSVRTYLSVLTGDRNVVT